MPAEPSSSELAHRFPTLAAGLRGHDLDAFFGAFAPRTVPSGAALVREGELAHTLFLVLGGRISVIVETGGAPIEVGHLEPGAIVAEISFIDRGPSSATLVATEATSVLTLEREAFDALGEAHPAIATALLAGVCQNLAARIRSATDRFDELSPGRPIERPPHGLLHRLRALFGLEAGATP